MIFGTTVLRCIKLIIERRGVCSLLIVALLLTTTGCQFAPKKSTFAWPWSKKGEKKIPDRLLPVWSDTVLYQTNMPGVRGFGGRIYFYEKDETDPIEVDGGMAIYVFDADNAESNHQKPLRKFVFTAEQFASHMSRTSIGPSYSIWLPWGDVGGPPQRLSLIARFEGKEGGTVISDPTIKLLPGVPEAKQTSASGEGDSSKIQLASHASNADAMADGHATAEGRATSAETAEAKRRRLIGTIDLPPSFNRHLYSSDATLDATSNAEVQELEGPPLLNGPQTGPNDDNSDVNLSGSRVSFPTADAASLAVGPVTTTVIDHRSRMKAATTDPSGYSGSRTPRDIRQGTWIESVR